MTKRFLLTLIWIAVILVVWEISPALGQREFHGADSVFEKDGITILWAILKGPTEESSWVHIKIICSEESVSRFQFFSMEAEDPFSKAKEWLVRGVILEKENLVKNPRSSFNDKTSRRIIFYRNREDFLREKPMMTVFYLSVPDTSPEILLEKEMDNYFEKALERLKKQ
jgi:hypothetical protein